MRKRPVLFRSGRLLSLGFAQQLIMSSDRLTLLQGMLADNPSDAFLLFALAKEHEKLGDGPQAMDFYLKLAAQHPDYVGNYYHLGKAYEAVRQEAKAFFTYKKGMDVARAAGDQHAYNELAAAKLFLGDDDDFEETDLV